MGKVVGGGKLKRVKCSKDVLLLTLIVASLIAPILTMSSLSVSPVSASPSSAEFVVRGKSTAYNIDQRGNKPWLDYLVGDRPPLMVANRVGSGGIFVATSSTCRNGRWNAANNPYPHYDVLLDVAFQWMKPGATQVLWYEGHNVYNSRSVCSQLVSSLENLGYTISGSTTAPITSDLLAPYDILVIPQMEEGNAGTGGDNTKVSDAEVQAIKSWVESGHGLVIMEASDFSGYNYNFVQNKVIDGMTDGYFFQDDQVSDSNCWGGGTAYYNVIGDVDTTTAIGAAYQTKTGGTGVGLYSVCSLAKAGPGVSMFIMSQYQVGMPGTTFTYTVWIYNPKNPQAVDLTYNLTVGDTKGWAPSLENSSVFVPVGENRKTYLDVTIPAGASIGTEDTMTVNLVAVGYPNVTASSTCVAHAGLRIEPTSDTYVSDQDPAANYNSENSLRIGRYNQYWQEDYLKFDLSGIPSGISPEKITSAKLCLFAYYTYSGGFDVRCDSVDDDGWIETGITWNNKPTPGATLDTTFVNQASSDSPIPYFWDITSFVKQELAGDKLVSLCMLPPDTLENSISRAFWSKERYENRTHPLLMIDYASENAPPKVSVSISPSSKGGLPGSSLSYTVTVKNEGGVSDTYSLTTADNASWSRTISPTSLSLAGGASGTATLTVAIPSGVNIGTIDNVSVTAIGTSASASASCIAQASAGGVEVSISPTSQDGSPGAALTYTVTVTNTGGTADNYILTKSDNAVWSLSLSPSTLSLAVGASGTSTLTVTISASAENNAQDNVTVTATSQTNSSVSGNASCTARCVKISGGVQVTISENSKSGNPGERLQFSVTFTNTGTATATFDLGASDTKSWGPTLSVTPPRITLAGGASRTIGLSITIPSTAAAGDSTTITVTAAGTSATCTATAQAGGGISPFVYVGVVVVIVVIIAVVLVVKLF